MARNLPPKLPRPQPAPRVTSPCISELAERVFARPGEQLAIVEDFWLSLSKSPLLEDAGPAEKQIVTFLFRSRDAAEVFLFVNRMTDERDLAASLMEQVPGTDLWHLSYLMSENWRASYSYVLRMPGQNWPWVEGDQLSVRRALDNGVADPLNPDSHLNRAGVRQSIVSLSKAPSSDWVSTNLGSREDFREAIIGNEKRVWCRPVLVSDSAVEQEAELPVLIAFDGDVWSSNQDLFGMLQNLVSAQEIPPLLLVLVDAGGREHRWRELGEPLVVSNWLTVELLPWLRFHYNVSSQAERIIVAGQSLGGVSALTAILTQSGEVGVAISQSASLWGDRVPSIPESSDFKGRKIYLSVGEQEWILAGPNRVFAKELEDAGFQVEYTEFNGGHDYACWRVDLSHALISCFS